MLTYPYNKNCAGMCDFIFALNKVDYKVTQRSNGEEVSTPNNFFKHIFNNRILKMVSWHPLFHPTIGSLYVAIDVTNILIQREEI